MDNADHIPRRQEGYRTENMGEDVLLYCAAALKTIYLNETAAAVWALCDGEHSVRQIADKLAAAYRENVVELQGDVRTTLDQLLREGALRLDPPGPAPEIPDPS